jgi:hypothetical protein
MVIMAGTAGKTSKTGIVEIKKCGFNRRPKLLVPDRASDDDATIDVLPDLFNDYGSKRVKVTIEIVQG